MSVNLVSSEDLAKKLNVDPDTINRMRKSGRIVGYRLGRRYRYDLDEVLNALRDDPKQPIPQP